MLFQSQTRRLAVTGKALFFIIFSLTASFLLARVSITQEMYPFGTAFIICSFNTKARVNPYLCTVGVFISYCTLLGSLPCPEYSFLSACLITAVFTLIKITGWAPNIPVKISAVALCFLVPAIIFKSNIFLSLLYALLEALTAVLSAIAFKNALDVINEKSRRKVLNSREFLCVGLLLSLSIAGTGGLSVLKIRLADVFAALFIAVISYVCETEAATVCAALCAAACLLANGDPGFAVSLMLTSLTASLFNRVIKPLFAPVFLLCSSVYVLLFSLELINLAEYAISSLLFLPIPARFISRIKIYTLPEASRENTLGLMQKRLREASLGEITKISRSLKSAARGLKSETELRKSPDIRYYIQNIPEQCCEKCEKYDVCWDKQFKNTYGFMKNMFNRYRLAGKITEKDISSQYITSCEKPKRLISVLNGVFHDYLCSVKWENKVSESRIALSEQLIGAANALSSLESRISQKMKTDGKKETSLICSLDKNGVYVSDVMYMESCSEPYVSIRLKGCKQDGACNNKILKCVNEVCQTKMHLKGEPICSKSGCVLNYEPAQNIYLKTAVSTAKKDGSVISGDTYSLKPLSDGRYMLLICDGMGSGETAHRESSCAAGLIEDFYTAGFKSSDILNMTNKLMLLSSSDEVFSALDLCIVDMRNSVAHFSKIGAPHSYILKENGIRRVSGGALPLGILEDLEPAEHTAELCPGDLIIMFSDGVSEAELSDSVVYEEIKRISRIDNVNLIADKIISSALKSYDGKAKDDMTVIVSRIVA